MATRDDVERVRAARPCSVELPAGCGKTEFIVRLADAAQTDGKPSLVLTHTHAGVDALRRRLRRLGVSPDAAVVRTIDSWCTDLIASFPTLSDFDMPDEPDWRDAPQYHLAGDRAAGTSAVRRMLAASYSQLIIDEYQDCSIWQHQLICGMARTVPTVVLGDRMQGILFFSDNRPVDWEADVLPAFPAVAIPLTPWRWQNTNPELGSWLLDARQRLLDGRGLNLAGSPVAIGVPTDISQVCWAQPRHPDRVAVLAKWPNDCAMLARSLGGSYSMIEEVEGKFLLAFAATFDQGSPGERAAAVVQFSVDCAFGVAEIVDSPSRRRLQMGKALTAQRFDGVAPVRDAVNRMLVDPSPNAARDALGVLRTLPKFRLFRREAWHGISDALRLSTVDQDVSVRDSVVQTRNHLRVVGRYPESRILARPLLVKGLEFDHVVLTDPHQYNAHELYVCLTRGSKSLTLVTDRNSFSPSRPRNPD